MDTNEKSEYIKALISNLEAQKKYILLYVTFSVGIIAILMNKLILTESLIQLQSVQKLLLAIALLSLTMSAMLHFVWITLIHRLSIKAIDLFITLDIEEARRTHYPGERFWNRWGWIAILAKMMLIIGLIACMIFIWTKIYSMSPTT